MPTRYDTSAVPPQGGYVAKRCPVRVQNDVLRPAEPLPASAFRERLAAQGRAFEAEVVAELVTLHRNAVVVDAGGAAAEAVTVEAMRRRESLVVGGRLPTDLIGRRVGRPDLLVVSAGGGYRAVDVKNHMSLEAAPPQRNGARACTSTLEGLSLEA